MLLIEIEKLWNIDGQMLTLVVDFLGDVLNTTSKSLSPNRASRSVLGYFHNFLNHLFFMLTIQITQEFYNGQQVQDALETIAVQVKH